MNRTLIALISLVLLFTACSHNKPTTTAKKGPLKALTKVRDSLAYTYERESGENAHCNCDYIAISYPVFKTKTVLNDTIKQMVVGTLSGYDEDDKDKTKSLAERVKIVVKNNTTEIDTSDGQRIPTTYELHISVKSQDPNLLILEAYEEISGGAHPNSNSTYLSWSTQKDKKIVLDDVLVKNYNSKLGAIADKIIREEKLNEDLLEGDTFALNSNYYFAPDGLHFYYNSYEIKPYAEGPTDLLVPYSKIKELIRPGSVLSQYIK